MSSYPRQPAPQVYPTQQYPQYNYPAGTYPYQQPYNTQPMVSATPSAPPAYGPPPPYTEYPNQMPMQAPSPYQPYQPMPGTYPVQQPHTIVAPGLWDSGARFDGVAQPRIPPPPPGVSPNSTQLAAMQGHRIVGSQQSENLFTGNRNDGGYTFGF